MPRACDAIRYHCHMSEQEQFDAHAEILSKIIGQAKKLIQSFKVAPQTKNKKIFALIILNEIISKCESVEAMARANTWSGINTVTRSALESYADLLNVLTYGDDYADYMSWMSLNQQRSTFQAIVSNPASKYAKILEAGLKVTQGRTPTDILAETKRQMGAAEQRLTDKFKNKNGGVRNRDIFRFELADKVDEYDMLYRRLSASAHGRVSDMLNGIMHGNKIRWPPTDPDEPPLVAIDCLCSFLIESCGYVAKAFNRTDVPLRALAKEHLALRRPMADHIGRRMNVILSPWRRAS